MWFVCVVAILSLLLFLIKTFLPNKRIDKMSLFSKLLSVLCIFMTIISFTMAGCGSSPQSTQAKIDRMAKDMKADLPKMLDSDTKLVNVYTKEFEIISEYELVNYKPGEKDKINPEGKINSYLTTQVCPSIKKDLLSIGVSVRYIYKGNDGQLIVNRVFKPGDC